MCRSAALVLGLAVLGVGLAAGAEDRALPAFKDIDSMEARVQGCVTCHGQSGEGTNNDYFPRIAGKPAGYLFNQLVAFRDGKRKYAPMNYLVAYLPDNYLREMADHFSKLRPPFDTSSSSAAAPGDTERGKSIVMTGDASKQVPACMACHGGKLTGTEPGIPGLVGLRPAYIAAQLTRWRVGVRTAAEPDCMKRIASRLSESDVAAVAAWLGMQPPPADPSPQAPSSIRMPLACGSQK
jgi:cytochrome c553